MVEVKDQWMKPGLGQEYLVDFQLYGKQAGATSKLLSVFCFCVHKEIMYVKTFINPSGPAFVGRKQTDPSFQE